MAIDWDALVLAPVMAAFGEGSPVDQASWPIYKPVGGAAFALADAVFDRAYAEVELDPEQGQVTNRKPCLGVRRSLFVADPAQNDLVYVPSVGITFVVKNPEPDGHGHVKLILQATSKPPIQVAP